MTPTPARPTLELALAEDDTARATDEDWTTEEVTRNDVVVGATEIEVVVVLADEAAETDVVTARPEEADDAVATAAAAEDVLNWTEVVDIES